MEMDKKQKTMLGVLAVLVIGAGGAWYVFNSGGSSSNVVVDQGAFQKKERKTRDATKDKNVKKTRKKAGRKKAEVRQRETFERKKAKKKSRRSKRKGQEKKKKILPVA